MAGRRPALKMSAWTCPRLSTHTQTTAWKVSVLVTKQNLFVLSWHQHQLSLLCIVSILLKLINSIR